MSAAPQTSRATIGWVAVLGLLAAVWLAAGCGGSDNPYHRREPRQYEMPVELEQLVEVREAGSLWSSNATSNFLFTDQRAFRVGDLLTIEVEEFANAQRGASTSTSRESDLNANITAFLGLMERLQDLDPNIDPSALVAAQSSSTFNGLGQTGRSERLEATVQVMVRAVLPSGNLFVEGERVIVVNDEEHYFYVSGVARPVDIDESNVLPSSRLAEAQIEFVGRGIISDQQSPGILQRVFNWIWPF